MAMDGHERIREMSVGLGRLWLLARQPCWPKPPSHLPPTRRWTSLLGSPNWRPRRSRCGPRCNRCGSVPFRLPAVDATPVATAAPSGRTCAGCPCCRRTNQPLEARQPATPAHLGRDSRRDEEARLDEGRFHDRSLWISLGQHGVFHRADLARQLYAVCAVAQHDRTESECIVDVRNTRLGFDVAGPKIPWLGDAISGGKVEIDFQNNVLSTENKPTILLRHAYFDVKDDDFRFLVGQTWDVISPLYPGMLMYSVGWDGGNIGYRRAQVPRRTIPHLLRRFAGYRATLDQPERVSRWHDLDQRRTVQLAHRRRTQSPGPWDIEDRTACRSRSACRATSAKRSSITAPSLVDNRRRTWSGNIDLRVPITHRLGFQAECQAGENLSTFLGGIGQGIDPTTLQHHPRRRRLVRSLVRLDADGSTATSVTRSTIRTTMTSHTTGERKYNQFYFGNLIYDVTKNFLVGVEVSSWKTLYVNQLPGDSLRTEFVAKYGF